MSWNDYELFLQVVRAGSIRAAARKLNTDHAAVSRRLVRLEAELAVKLLHRRSNGLTPTVAGQELFAAAEAMEFQATQAERQLAGRATGLEGWVRVSSNLPLGLKLLTPIITAFTARYPGIELAVSLSQRLTDLTRNEADVAIRIARAVPESMVAVRLCGFALCSYASTPDPTHWLGWDPDGPYDAFIKASGWANRPPRHRFVDDLLTLEAAAQGLGAAVLPCMLGDAEPRLVRLGPVETVASVFVLRHPDHVKTARISAFVSFLKETFAGTADLIEGRRVRTPSGNTRA